MSNSNDHVNNDHANYTQETLINDAFEQRVQLSIHQCPQNIRDAVNETLQALDQGRLRVAEKIDNQWRVHQWLKKAVLLSFKINGNQPIPAGYTQFYDKVNLKFANYTPEQWADSGIRAVPSAIVRAGSYIAPDVVLMPSYVNIGAYVDQGTMVDTWATVGSCAQIGKRVHLSGGVGIGGVLEPLQANPTIIEDDCFIGARSEIVEGVIVGAGAVISMGVYISQSTRIYDRETGSTHFGYVPPGAVVVPGALPSADGSYSLYAAIIVKKVDAKTREKVGINALLRDAMQN